MTFFAVCAGVDQTPGARTLRFAEKDASDVFQMLVGDEGPVGLAEARCLRGASMAGLEVALAEALVAAPRYFILYFSGHGSEDGLACSDGLFHFAKLARWLKLIGAEKSLCVLDTCHSASFNRFMKIAGEPGFAGVPTVSWFELLASATPGIRLAFSTGADRLSVESPAYQNGVFTHFFLRGLRKARPDLRASGDSFVSDRRAFDYARWAVRERHPDQTPEQYGLDGTLPLCRPDGSNLVGDGWIERLEVLPTSLRVHLTVEGRRFVDTSIRFTVLSLPTRRHLTAGLIPLHLSSSEENGYIDVPFRQSWIFEDPTSYFYLMNGGVARYTYVVGLVDSDGNALSPVSMMDAQMTL